MTVFVSCGHGDENFELYKRGAISCIDEWLSASEEGSWSMELMSI